MYDIKTPRCTLAGRDGRAADQPKQSNHGLVRFGLIRRVATIMALVTALASNASAQEVATPELEIAGGYQFSRSFRALSPQEWFLSAAAPLDGRMALVGEVAGTMGEGFGFTPAIGSGITLRLADKGQTALIGLRYAWSGRRMTPFVQGLVGGARVSYSGLSDDDVTSLFGAWQVGGGVDVPIARRFAARFAANFLTLQSGRFRLRGSDSNVRFRFLAGAVLKVPAPSDAQTLDAPLLEIAGGYQGFSNLSRLPYPRGWFVSLGRPLNEQLSVVGEIADANFLEETPMIFVEEEHQRTYLAGIRYAWPGQRIIPFVQALGGMGVFSRREDALYEEPQHTRIHTDRYIAHQFTGGVDIAIARRLAARFTASNLTIYEYGAGVNILRFSSGLVVRIGGS